MTLIGKKRISQVNEQFLEHTGPTDVITFDYRDDAAAEADDEPVLGELLVCPEVAAAAAAELGHSIGYEVVLYSIHGFLHLAGYDDHEADEIAAMRQAEAEIMDVLAREYDLAAIF